MPKGKKFTAAEKHFQGIIDSKNKTINILTKNRDELLNEKYSLTKENEDLKSKLEYANKALEELGKLNNLSSEDIKALVDRAVALNTVCEIISNKSVNNLMRGLY